MKTFYKIGAVVLIICAMIVGVCVLSQEYPKPINLDSSSVVETIPNTIEEILETEPVSISTIERKEINTLFADGGTFTVNVIATEKDAASGYVGIEFFIIDDKGNFVTFKVSDININGNVLDTETSGIEFFGDVKFSNEMLKSLLEMAKSSKLVNRNSVRIDNISPLTLTIK